jgi:hypothetical protein
MHRISDSNCYLQLDRNKIEAFQTPAFFSLYLLEVHKRYI